MFGLQSRTPEPANIGFYVGDVFRSDYEIITFKKRFCGRRYFIVNRPHGFIRPQHISSIERRHRRRENHGNYGVGLGQAG